MGDFHSLPSYVWQQTDSWSVHQSVRVIFVQFSSGVSLGFHGYFMDSSFPQLRDTVPSRHLESAQAWSAPFRCTQHKNPARGDLNRPNYKTFPDHVSHLGNSRAEMGLVFILPAVCARALISGDQSRKLTSLPTCSRQQPSLTCLSTGWAWSHFPHKLWE